MVVAGRHEETVAFHDRRIAVDAAPADRARHLAVLAFPKDFTGLRVDAVDFGSGHDDQLVADQGGSHIGAMVMVGLGFPDDGAVCDFQRDDKRLVAARHHEHISVFDDRRLRHAPMPETGLVC